MTAVPENARTPRPNHETDPFIRTLREGIDAQLFAVDAQLRYVTFNLAHAEHMERVCRARPAVGTPITDLVTDLTGRAKLFADLQRALAGERHGTMGWWRPCQSEERLIEGDFFPVRDEGDRIIGVAVVMRDRTEPTEQEVAYRNLERRYHALLHATADAIVVVGEEGQVVECNEAFARLVGMDPVRAQSGHISDWYAGPRKADAMIDHQLCLQRGRRLDAVIRRQDGTYVPVEVTASPVTLGGARCVLYDVRDITERRRAEVALVEKESRLRAIVDNAPIGIGVADLVTGELIKANAAMLKMYGRTLDEARGHPLNSFTHPEDQVAERQLLASLANGQAESYTLRKRYVRPDGTTVPVELKVLRLPDELGRHPLALGIGMDLGEIAEAERSLRESEERYRRLADNAQDIIYRIRVHPTPAMEYISPRVEQLVGHSPAEYYADPDLPFRVIHEEDREMLAALLAGKADLGIPRMLRWNRPDGSVIWLEHRSTAIRDTDGTLLAIEGIARDMSDQMARDHQLRLVGRALDQAVEAVVITDRSGRIVEVNASFERVTGYTQAEVLGQNPRLLKSGKQPPEFYQRMWRELSAGRVFSANVVNARKDGTYYDAELVVSPVRDAAGVVSHFVGIQRDVTQERIRDAQLRQAQKMEAMGQVTGGIAHDFNNLLTVILATANLIESELPAGSESARWLADLLSSAQHGTLMVRQLLAFSRQEILAPGPTDLDAVTRTFRTVLHRLIPETITIAPITGKAPLAHADRTALEQILLNLANNAKDAMPTGGAITLTLGDRTDPETGKRFATISVTDTGTGMDAETLRRCTEPFFTTKPVGKGTGLGLPMVHGLMQQLGGRVDIESVVGNGTTFTLLFPVAEAHTATPIPLPSRPATGALRGHILLVEDNDALRRVALRTLERAGCTVVAMQDGQEAWETWQAEEGRFDLVLTDAVMPRLGGIALIQRLRGAGATLPIILMSGYTSEDLTDLQQDVHLLAKPWTGETLLHRINEALAGTLH